MSPYACDQARCVEECWDWVTPDDVLRFAMAAVDLARRACVPPVGEPFMAEGVSWVGRHDFVHHLARAFELQLQTRAYQLGIRGSGGDDFEGSAVALAQWAKDHPALLSTGAAV